MTKPSAVDAVHNFFAHVWQAPQNYDAIDDLVVEDFVLITGGRRVESRAAFKEWARNFGTVIDNLEFEVVESFANHDGSRVASMWRLTGNNNGALRTTPDGAPIEMTGTAVWAVREDGKLLWNRVERNAFEVYQQLTNGAA
ncbi:ester cyclase [Streptomyces sp. NBC_00306]|uniref:ester cyclase n=1 Tax=Streptomyces sp. NBC_00306 TaxID=2975708 RepID=UPI002E27B2D2|nr:nuclear transport factor 2 family protein [Streptomyces sp. NBC_00306]